MKLLFISLIALLCVAGSLGKKSEGNILSEKLPGNKSPEKKVEGNSSVENKYQCTFGYESFSDTWADMVDSCVDKLKSQVEMEVGAALTYLSMGAYFARDTINRPGFSKFFFEAASEEREHAIKIIEYLLMRGELSSDIGSLLKFSAKPNNNWHNGLFALKQALKLEADVTRSLREIIAKCENSTVSDAKSNLKATNDYHLVDYLSGDFLEEQYKGQRDLAGKITTLSKMVKSQKHLGEFLFDKKLLNGEV